MNTQSNATNFLAAVGLMAILALAMQLVSIAVSDVAEADARYEQGQKDMIAEHIAFVESKIQNDSYQY